MHVNIDIIESLVAAVVLTVVVVTACHLLYWANTVSGMQSQQQQFQLACMFQRSHATERRVEEAPYRWVLDSDYKDIFGHDASEDGRRPQWEEIDGQWEWGCKIYEFDPRIRRVIDSRRRENRLDQQLDVGTADGGEFRPGQLQESYAAACQQVVPVATSAQRMQRAREGSTVEHMLHQLLNRRPVAALSLTAAPSEALALSHAGGVLPVEGAAMDTSGLLADLDELDLHTEETFAPAGLGWGATPKPELPVPHPKGKSKAKHSGHGPKDSGARPSQWPLLPASSHGPVMPAPPLQLAKKSAATGSAPAPVMPVVPPVSVQAPVPVASGPVHLRTTRPPAGGSACRSEGGSGGNGGGGGCPKGRWCECRCQRRAGACGKGGPNSQWHQWGHAAAAKGEGYQN